ncbi:PhzF family phenazine biosynthesis protein [Pseudomaricurvus sp.]|uniref:PhzF family phenazine biosynthesis protein n=1 Tax=Pseudomaricurvus sp. TaxID=2004510 RepID=UPI003F6B1109
MKLPIYQIDAFTGRLFKGNPAAVVPLTDWLDDNQLLNIAAENNLSETAFYVPAQTGEVDKDGAAFDFHLRWFTPTHEVDLCGHATLAAAHALFDGLDSANPCTSTVIRFRSRSGILTVTKEAEGLTLNFPARPAVPQPVPEEMLQALGLESVLFSGKSPRDWLLIVDNEATVANLKPNLHLLANASDAPVIVSAQGDACDFVSRFFAPRLGVDEDPVTGSAHCTLTPYWAEALDRNILSARQISARGGDLLCRLEGEQGVRVSLTGQAVTYLEGSIRY